MLEDLKEAIVDVAAVVGLLVIVVLLIPYLLQLFSMLWIPIVEMLYLYLYPDLARHSV